MAIYMWRDVQVPADALYFEAAEANSTIEITQTGTPTAVTFETSINWGSWTDYTIWNTITLSNIGDKIYIRNKSETPTNFSTSYTNGYRIGGTGKIEAHWDINYLLCKNSTTALTSNYCFSRLFQSNTSLILPPKLPATTLTTYCYSGMFSSCTNLEGLPEIPATTMTNYCCYQMFQNSSKIKMSQTQTWEYTNEYRIPTTWTWTTATSWNNSMFSGTWWTFTWNAVINTTYYTSNTLV